MDDVRNGTWNVLPDEADDPELDAAWAAIDPAETERVTVALDATFEEVEADRAAVGRLNAGIDEDDTRLHPDAESDEGTPDEIVDAEDEPVGEQAFLPDDPTVTDDPVPGPAEAGEGDTT